MKCYTEVLLTTTSATTTIVAARCRFYWTRDHCKYCCFTAVDNQNRFKIVSKFMTTTSNSGRCKRYWLYVLVITAIHAGALSVVV